MRVLTRQGAREAARRDLAHFALSPLPPAAVYLIFSLVPLDTRLRCSAVCRAWRAFLCADTRLWSRVDLRCLDSDRVPAQKVLLRAASARAKGCVEFLALSGDDVPPSTVEAVCTANAACLRVVRLDKRRLDDDGLARVCRAAPGCALHIPLPRHCNAAQLVAARVAALWWPFRRRPHSLSSLQLCPSSDARRVAGWWKSTRRCTT